MQSVSSQGATEAPSGSLVGGQPHDRPEPVSSELPEGSIGTDRDVSGDVSGSPLQPEDASRGMSEDSAGSRGRSSGGAGIIGIIEGGGGSVVGSVVGASVRPMSAQRKSGGASRPTSAVKLHSRPNSALVPSISMARKEGEMPSAAVVLVEGD